MKKLKSWQLRLIGLALIALPFCVAGVVCSWLGGSYWADFLSVMWMLLGAFVFLIAFLVVLFGVLVLMAA